MLRRIAAVKQNWWISEYAELEPFTDDVVWKREYIFVPEDARGGVVGKKTLGPYPSADACRRALVGNAGVLWLGFPLINWVGDYPHFVPEPLFKWCAENATDRETKDRYIALWLQIRNAPEFTGWQSSAFQHVKLCP